MLNKKMIQHEYNFMTCSNKDLFLFYKSLFKKSVSSFKSDFVFISQKMFVSKLKYVMYVIQVANHCDIFMEIKIKPEISVKNDLKR